MSYLLLAVGIVVAANVVSLALCAAAGEADKKQAGRLEKAWRQ